MKLPSYAASKPSGTDWLGHVPEHWEVLSIKRLTPVSRGASPRPIEDPKYFDDEGEYVWVRIADVTSNHHYLRETTQRLSELGKSLSVPLEPGSLFLSIAGSVGKPMITAIKACIHDGFVYFPRIEINREFLYYIFESGQPYLGLGKFGTQLNLNTDTVGSIKIGLPPRSEQDAIAAFLEWKTGQIDALMAQKQKLLEKLKEKRLAVITQAVTSGINPAAPLRDSGIPWLGHVPAHWEVMKVKFVAKMESGHTPSRSAPANWVEDECVIPWVSLNDTKFLKDNDFIGDTAVRISEEGMKNSSAHLLPAGVVLFTRDATIGLTAITTCASAVSQHIIAWAPGPMITPKYLLLSFKAMQQYLESFTFGSTLKTIGMSDVRKLVTPVPPVPEQNAITAHLDSEMAKLDGLVKKVEAAVERLQEYRTALITAATTGKIDVRGVKIPQPVQP